MKKIIESIKSKKEYIVYPVIGFALVAYEYGLETSFYWIAVLYAMFMTIFNSIELYQLLKTRNILGEWKIESRQVVYLTITTALIIVCYAILSTKLRLLSLSFSSIILVILLVYDLINSNVHRRYKDSEKY